MLKYKRQIIVCALIAAAYAAILIPALIAGGGEGLADGNIHNTLVCFSIPAFGLWGYYILFRVQEKTVRNIMAAIVAVILFWLFTRTVKWMLPAGGVGRHLWYVYYSALIGLPVLWLFLCAELFLDRLQKYKKRAYAALSAAAAALFVLVMTNDLHRFVFSFPDITLYNDYNYGAGYFIVLAFSALSLIAAFALYVGGTVRRNGLRQFLAPGAVLAALLVYSALYLTVYDTLAKVRPFNDLVLLVSLFAFLLIEMSLRCGLIQNSGKYRRYFEHASPPLRVSDGSGAAAYTSKGFIPETEGAGGGLVYETRGLHGGTLSVQKNVSALRGLRREFTLKAARLKRENRLLENRKALLAEEAALFHRNALLTGIGRSVSEKRAEIERMAYGLPDTVDGRNKRRVAETLALIKLAASYMKQKCLLGLSAETGGEALAKSFGLALGSMMKDAESVKIKSAYAVNGEADAETALCFLKFAADICGVFAFSGAAFYITANFGRGAVCRVLTDKPAPKAAFADLPKAFDGAAVTEENEGGGYSYSARRGV